MCIRDSSSTINNIPDKDLASASAAEAILDTLVNNNTPGDEIDSIIITFSNLFKKNTQLNTAIRQHELEIEKSKFTILQEQINPHFLYNSLDTIRICMLMDKKETACRLIQSLSQFYRCLLYTSRHVIKLIIHRVAMIGFSRGSMIRTNAPAIVAPSILAASSKEDGI